MLTWNTKVHGNSAKCEDKLELKASAHIEHVIKQNKKAPADAPTLNMDNTNVCRTTHWGSKPALAQHVYIYTYIIYTYTTFGSHTYISVHKYVYTVSTHIYTLQICVDAHIFILSLIFLTCQWILHYVCTSNPWQVKSPLGPYMCMCVSTLCIRVPKSQTSADVKTILDLHIPCEKT